MQRGHADDDGDDDGHEMDNRQAKEQAVACRVGGGEAGRVVDGDVFVGELNHVRRGAGRGAHFASRLRPARRWSWVTMRATCENYRSLRPTV